MSDWNASSVKSIFACTNRLHYDKYYYPQDQWNDGSAKSNSTPGKSMLYLQISDGKIQHLEHKASGLFFFSPLLSISF